TFHKMPPNKAIWIAVVLVIVAQSAICFTPVFQTIFGTASPSWEDVLIVITTSVVMYIVLQGERMLRRAVQRFI
ncbi:MAG: cation transporting ATPase C-terminal domain-containing protein, partial [Pseudomonadota bacterium]|nr:cation transporting ATPase C-terminal domain-containing protein [Pseudomonadota bacterium]